VLRRGAVRKVDVFRQRRHQIVGPQACRNGVRISHVEARPAAQPLFRNAFLLALLGAGALGVDAPVLALATRAQIVELVLELTSAPRVAFLLDAPLELFFAVTLLDRSDVNRRARVVTEGAEAT